MSINYVTLVTLKVAITRPTKVAIVIMFDDLDVGPPCGPWMNNKKGLSDIYCVARYL